MQFSDTRSNRATLGRGNCFGYLKTELVVLDTKPTKLNRKRVLEWLFRFKALGGPLSWQNENKHAYPQCSLYGHILRSWSSTLTQTQNLGWIAAYPATRIYISYIQIFPITVAYHELIIAIHHWGFGPIRLTPHMAIRKFKFVSFFEYYECRIYLQQLQCIILTHFSLQCHHDPGYTLRGDKTIGRKIAYIGG